MAWPSETGPPHPIVFATRKTRLTPNHTEITAAVMSSWGRWPSADPTPPRATGWPNRISRSLIIRHCRYRARSLEVSVFRRRPGRRAGDLVDAILPGRDRNFRTVDEQARRNLPAGCRRADQLNCSKIIFLAKHARRSPPYDQEIADKEYSDRRA